MRDTFTSILSATSKFVWNLIAYFTVRLFPDAGAARFVVQIRLEVEDTSLS